MSDEENQSFRHFASALEEAIKKYGHLTTKEEVRAVQKKQVEHLSALEEEFRVTVCKHRYGPKVYKAFVSHICDTRRNILAARPYFRERQEVFTEHISSALKDRAWRRLRKWHVNWQFVSFALKAVKWDRSSKVVAIAKQIEAARWELCELNLPLAISRSRIFWSRTPRSHLSFLDLVQISAEGLLAAIDKFVLPYSDVFCDVIIGRCTGNFIDCYSDTMLHFFPTDRRKIYRANKFLSKHPHGVDPQAMADAVNKDASGRQVTSADEISDLISAARVVSADSSAPREEDGFRAAENIRSSVARFEAPADTRPDVRAEEHEAMQAMQRAATTLSLVDRKFLRLKGVDIALQ